jgi:hypothetical protein
MPATADRAADPLERVEPVDDPAIVQARTLDMLKDEGPVTETPHWFVAAVDQAHGSLVGVK